MYLLEKSNIKLYYTGFDEVASTDLPQNYGLVRFKVAKWFQIGKY